MTALSRALLTGLVDYAGLFPPAGLGMRETVASFAAYQSRPDRWALARLVVPVARLGEFEEAWAGLDAGLRRTTRWPIAALAGNDPAGDRAAIVAFNQRHGGGGPRVEAVEARLTAAADAARLEPLLEPGVEVYCELPLSADLPGLVAAVGRVGARAKVRTGGIKAPDIPPPEAVLAFLVACASARLPFKATAGLHHPVRGPARLTYEAGSACATMFGYLNLVLAAARLWSGGSEREALTLLTADAGSGLCLDPETAHWGGLSLSAAEIARARQEFVCSIGSCSFTEPLGEIVALGLDPQAVEPAPFARSTA